MKKEEDKEAIKKLEELFEKHREEVGLRMAHKFYKKNKRIPKEKEMLEISNKAGEEVADFWKKYPKNFKWKKKELRCPRGISIQDVERTCGDKCGWLKESKGGDK